MLVCHEAQLPMITRSHIAISTDVTCYASLYILDHSVNGFAIIQLKLGETYKGAGMGGVSKGRLIV